MRTFLLFAALVWHSASAQTATLSLRDVVANPLAGFSVTATVDRDPTGHVIPGYQVGESLGITLRTDRDAFVYLFNVRANGTVALFFPNDRDPDHLLLADQPRVLPGAGYTLDLEGPTGLDKVVAVASLDPLDLGSLLRATERGGFARADLNERAFAQALTRVLQVLDANTWAAHTVAFYIADAVEAETPAYGIVRIESLPQAAAVYVDGVAQGVTPLALYGLPGAYTLRLEVDGYEPYVATVDLAENARLTIEATLLQTPTIGRLDLHLNVHGATVHLNGHPHPTGGATSITFADLLAGAYEVTATAPGHHSRIAQVAIAGGGSHELVLELTPIAPHRPSGAGEGR